MLFYNKPLWNYAYERAINIVGTGNIIAVGKDITGGETINVSVLKWTLALPKDTERVIILEGTRPMVKKQIIWILNYTYPSTTSKMMYHVLFDISLPIDSLLTPKIKIETGLILPKLDDNVFNTAKLILQNKI